MLDLKTLTTTIKEARKNGRPARRKRALTRDDPVLEEDANEAEDDLETAPVQPGLASDDSDNDEGEDGDEDEARSRQIKSPASSPYTSAR